MPPESLFKYTKAETAFTILDGQTLLWSSPVIFNDPSDIRDYFHLDFLWEDLQREVLQELKAIVRSSAEPTFSADNELVPFIKSWRKDNEKLTDWVLETSQHRSERYLFFL
jgi:hypothetical protein